jgi:putative tryptophan/tyrosine transport system substrate-binding protein
MKTYAFQSQDSKGRRRFYAADAARPRRRGDPMMGFMGPMVSAGAFISNGPLPAIFRRSARLVDRILKGAKPAELPFEQPTDYELVINLKTAKRLGIAIAPTLLARADEVIE